MGRCHEFGLQISEGCNHEMLAGENECTCAGCGIACGGQFAGCPDVWARGQPKVVRTEVGIVAAATLERVGAGAPAKAASAAANGPSTPTNGPGTTANGVAATWEPEPPLPPVDTPWATVAPAPAAPASAPAAEGAPHPEPVPRSKATHATETESPKPEPVDSGAPRSEALAGVSAELRTVTEGLKLQQSMLGELLTGLTRQQAMMAELLDARHAELRLAMVAESLPDSVADAVSRSFAANQEQLTETALQLAKSIGMDAAVSKALRQTANRSEERFEDLSVRLEKLVAKAMRAGARQAEAAPASKRSGSALKPAARKKAPPAKRAQPAKKTSRASVQRTRPSRRSFGS